MPTLKLLLDGRYPSGGSTADGVVNDAFTARRDCVRVFPPSAMKNPGFRIKIVVSPNEDRFFHNVEQL